MTANRTPRPMALPPQTGSPAPLYDGQGTLVGYHVNGRLVPPPSILPNAGDADDLPMPPTAAAHHHLLNVGRQAITANQLARIDAHTAIDIDYRDQLFGAPRIDIDYRDQLFGAPRGGFRKFKVDRQTNRTRTDIITQTHEGIQAVMAVAKEAIVDAFAGRVDEQHASWQEAARERELAHQERVLHVEAQYGAAGQQHAFELAKQRQDGATALDLERIKSQTVVQQEQARTEVRPW